MVGVLPQQKADDSGQEQKEQDAGIATDAAPNSFQK